MFRLKLKGMTQLDFSGGYVPCQLQLSGGQAFPLLKTWKEEILIAGCSYGRGKMVVASHESMLPDRSVRAFVRKALAWLQPSPSSPVGFHSTMHSLFTELQGSGLNLVSDAQVGESIGVYCRDAYDDWQKDQILSFVKKRGGLLIGGQAWHWSYSNGKHNAPHAFPGNKITGPAGIYFTGEVADRSRFQMYISHPAITQ